MINRKAETGRLRFHKANTAINSIKRCNDTAKPSSWFMVNSVMNRVEDIVSEENILVYFYTSKKFSKTK